MFNGERHARFQVHGSRIADLELAAPETAPTVPRNHQAANVQARAQEPLARKQSGNLPIPLTTPGERGPAVQPLAQSAPNMPVPTSKPYADPAILSVGSKPSPAPHDSVFEHAAEVTGTAVHNGPSTPVKPGQLGSRNRYSPHGLPTTGLSNAASATAHSVKSEAIARAMATAKVTPSPFAPIDEPNESDNPIGNHASGAMNGLLAAQAAPQKQQGSGVSGETVKRARRGGKAKKRNAAAGQEAPRINPAAILPSSPEVTRKRHDGRVDLQSKGWRQTPILQDQPQSYGRTPGVIDGNVGLEAATSSNRKERRQKAASARNGWATEDATDIQEMPEFDFATNLSKFDKRLVFDQIRNEDTTADEDRLVSLNRLPQARPGTNNGKNLHASENVLEKPGRVGASNDSSSSGEEEIASGLGSGRNSRRAALRATVAAAPALRKNSAAQDDNSHAMMNLTQANRLNRSFTRPIYSSSHTTMSRRASQQSPPESPSADSLRRHPDLLLIPSNHPCPTVTPGGIAAIEEIAEVEFGLSEDIMSENAGRGIAEVALLAINPGGRRLARENLDLNARPVLVVMAGNHKSGARAIAAARHLHARGPRVMVCMLGYERSADFDKDVRRQLDLFRKAGGHVKGWSSVQKTLKTLDAPPELIIDALLSSGRSFDGLIPADQAVALELVGWANKSKAHVLAVDCPSGVNGSTGMWAEQPNILPSLPLHPANPRAKLQARYPSSKASRSRCGPSSSSASGRRAPGWSRPCLRARAPAGSSGSSTSASTGPGAGCRASPKAARASGSAVSGSVRWSSSRQRRDERK